MRRNNKLYVLAAYRNLFRCSDTGTDSYVRLYLLPDQSWRHRKRTHVKKKTINPVFNDKYALMICPTSLYEKKNISCFFDYQLDVDTEYIYKSK